MKNRKSLIYAKKILFLLFDNLEINLCIDSYRELTKRKKTKKLFKHSHIFLCD